MSAQPSKTRIPSVRRAASAVGPTICFDLRPTPLTQIEARLKRTFDLALALIAIVVLLPLLIIVAVAIKMDSPGPVLFRQRRTGFDDRSFVIYKFRTMTVQEDGPNIVQARVGDCRITRVGKLMRRSSIDELPQLFNVLRGEMSLVGPRPHAVAHDHKYRQIIYEYPLRFYVKPGISGWAQINGLRGETAQIEEMERRIEFDLWYINNWSLRLDLSIVLRTCLEVLKERAY